MSTPHITLDDLDKKWNRRVNYHIVYYIWLLRYGGIDNISDFIKISESPFRKKLCSGQTLSSKSLKEVLSHTKLKKSFWNGSDIIDIGITLDNWKRLLWEWYGGEMFLTGSEENREEARKPKGTLNYSQDDVKMLIAYLIINREYINDCKLHTLLYYMDRDYIPDTKRERKCQTLAASFENTELKKKYFRKFVSYPACK